MYLIIGRIADMIVSTPISPLKGQMMMDAPYSDLI